MGRPAAGATRRDQVAPGRALPDPRRGDGGRPEDPRAGAARRPVHRRDLHARQYRDEGLPEESQRHRGSLRRRLVPLPATWRSAIPDGYIEIRDRLKDIIISGGENISTIELEGVLYRHPAVLEAAVVARPDEKGGNALCVHYPEDDHQGLAESEIIAFCRHLARVQIPRTVVFSELPKTSTGKIQKYVLREWAAAL
ncbi:AMP-binding enzyme [Pseudomonas aeruginosa]